MKVFTVDFAHNIGSPVTLTALQLRGVVVSLLFSAQGCQYQVAWWSDGQRRCEWLFDFEITP
jgi:hypothetical protein